MTDLDDARIDLVAAVRRLSAAGLSPGSSGNASTRLGDRVLMTPTGSRFATVRPEDLAIVRLDGSAAESGPRPSKEVPLHLAAYSAAPGAASVIHLHSPWATALACLPPDADGCAPLAVHTPYAAMRLGRLPVAPYAPPGSPELGEGVRVLAADAPVLLLAQHGSVAIAAGPHAAADLLEELEAAAQLAFALRGTAARTLPADEVRRLRGGTP